MTIRNKFFTIFKTMLLVCFFTFYIGEARCELNASAKSKALSECRKAYEYEQNFCKEYNNYGCGSGHHSVSRAAICSGYAAACPSGTPTLDPKIKTDLNYCMPYLHTVGWYEEDGELRKHEMKNGVQSGGVMDGCKPLPVKLAEIQLCLLCPLFRVVMKTDQTMATDAFKALAHPFMNVILMALALCIAYQTLLTVSALTKQDVGKFLTTVLIQAFKVACAVVLLLNSRNVYHYIIDPLFDGAIDFGLAIIDAELLNQIERYTAEFTGDFKEGVISTALLGKIMACIKMFSIEAAKLPTIGGSLICVSVNAASPFAGFPQPSMFLSGLMCLGFGWAIALSCCFYLLDSAVRFGIFGTILPFIIACAPFKATMKFAKKGWDIFMNTIFNFIMMGLIIALTTTLITQAMTGGNGDKEEIERLMNGNDVEALKEAMSLSGTKFLVMLACCIFAFKLVSQVNSLADKISGTEGGKGIASKMAGTAAQGATKLAQSGAKLAGQATGVSKVEQNIKDKFAQRNDAIYNRFAGKGKNPTLANTQKAAAKGGMGAVGPIVGGPKVGSPTGGASNDSGPTGSDSNGDGPTSGAPTDGAQNDGGNVNNTPMENDTPTNGDGSATTDERTES